MKLLIMGPPGAGKGTQAAILAEEFGLRHLSSGDLLRRSVQEGQELGRKAKSYMDSGGLVPDELMIELILNEVVTLVSEAKGFLLDGFPRTLEQAEALEESFGNHGVQIDRVINLKVEDTVVVSRLSGRRVCPECGKVYHVLDLPPLREGVCDLHPDKELYTRSDDHENVIRERLRVYQENTEPILGFYKKSGLILDIAGNQDKKEITRRIIAELGGNSESCGVSRG